MKGSNKMEDEYGDMDQVAGDFCDWYVERRMRVETERWIIDYRLRKLFIVLVDHEIRALFGHGNFIPRR